MAVKEKKPENQRKGKEARAKGKAFENRLDKSFEYYKAQGFAAIAKTPEPMRILSPAGAGRFTCCFTKKAQPDYEGTLKGGQSIRLEAKFTDLDQIGQVRLLDVQAEDFKLHAALGAKCFVIVGFASGNVYRIPWFVWHKMVKIYGRKYVTELDLGRYKVPETEDGTLLVLN
ncbi:Holliday junction resolvase RecU [Bengtsoniella intestinalis]|uniref:Holliday junction resolvase RecU n=1 Tax=Bengtsoniella intestinalis TaxID=3073143 RepID=UPI00391F968F